MNKIVSKIGIWQKCFIVWFDDQRTALLNSKHYIGQIDSNKDTGR